MESFVFSKLLPTIDLTPNKADDVDTSSFEQKQEELNKWKEEAAADKEKLKALQKEIKKARDQQGPVQMILGGMGKAVDNIASIVAEPVAAAAKVIEGLASTSKKN